MASACICCTSTCAASCCACRAWATGRVVGEGSAAAWWPQGAQHGRAGRSRAGRSSAELSRRACLQARLLDTRVLVRLEHRLVAALPPSAGVHAAIHRGPLLQRVKEGGSVAV